MTSMTRFLLITALFFPAACGLSEPVDAPSASSDSIGYRDINACVISSESVELLKKSGRTPPEQVDTFTSNFGFDSERRCYLQRWRFPADTRVRMSERGGQGRLAKYQV